MPRPSVVVLVALILAPLGALLGQSRVSQLVDSARVQLAANHLDSAEALLRAALDSTAQAAPADRNNALVWDGIVQFLRGHEDLARTARSEEHTSELQSPCNLVCRLLLEKKKKTRTRLQPHSTQRVP